MESCVQDLGGVELNAESFLHFEKFCKTFLVVSLRNVAKLDSTSRSWTQRRDVEIIPLENIATLDSNFAMLK